MIFKLRLIWYNFSVDLFQRPYTTEFIPAEFMALRSSSNSTVSSVVLAGSKYKALELPQQY